MKDRIKQIRKEAGMTQEAFGTAIASTKSTIASYEGGFRSPSPAIVRSICREFNVNETWLLTGEGAMHQPPTREQEIASLVSAVIKDDNYFRQALISVLIQLDEDQMQVLEKGLYMELQRLGLMDK